MQRRGDKKHGLGTPRIRFAEQERMNAVPTLWGYAPSAPKQFVSCLAKAKLVNKERRHPDNNLSEKVLKCYCTPYHAIVARVVHATPTSSAEKRATS